MLEGIELVQKREGKLVTSSLQVAEVFGKEHKNVLRDIENLTAQNAAVRMLFTKSTYINDRGREYKMYYMDKDGFALLAMGFNGSAALEFKIKYIAIFNDMERQLKEITTSSYMIEDPVKRAEKWIEEQKEKQLLSLQLEEQKPKVLLAESIENSNDLISIGDLAKILKQNGLDIGQNRLFERLRTLGYLVKGNGSKNSPTQRSMDLGVFKVVEGTYNSSSGSKIVKTTKVTGKGQKYFVNKFLKEVVE